MDVIVFLSKYLNPENVSFYIIARALASGFTVIYESMKFVPTHNRIHVYTVK